MKDDGLPYSVILGIQVASGKMDSMNFVCGGGGKDLNSEQIGAERRSIWSYVDLRWIVAVMNWLL